MKTWMPGLKNPGGLARSSEEDSKMKRAGVKGRMTTKVKTPLQTSGKGLRGAEQVQTFNTIITRGSTLSQSDDKDRSNRQLKAKQAQRWRPVSNKMTPLATADHLRILPARLDEAQDDTHHCRQPEEGGGHIIKTTDRARGAGTRCQRAKRRRQAV